ncbi:MAG: lipoate--protein ligase family protein [Planctomycetia bacterium]|nr:lipoate--protein ligase family protein [Planctomycetia bacterium]
MRGECKTPGGKLIAVEYQLQNERMHQIRISGDFFVHPDAQSREVLHRLASAIYDRHNDLTLQQWHHVLESALPWNVELLGTSTRALAVALCRARGDTVEIEQFSQHEEQFNSLEVAEKLTVWPSQSWHLIPEIALPPAMNVALDEVLCQQVASGKRPATLRFWRWTEQAVILGRCQSVLNEVDVEVAREKDIQLVRRMTGGGAMFLQPHGAITYSLYLPEALLKGMSVRQSYQICEAWVIEGLRKLGVDAYHAPLNDIACSMGKIGGAAQARRNSVVLHHTTMAYEMDPGEMVRVLRIGREKLSDKPAIASAAKRVSPLARQTGLPREAIVSSLFEHFRNQFGGTVSSLWPDEMQVAHELVMKKYGNDVWTYEIA